MQMALNMPPRDKVADIKAAQDLLNRGVTGIDFVKGLATKVILMWHKVF